MHSTLGSSSGLRSRTKPSGEGSPQRGHSQRTGHSQQARLQRGIEMFFRILTIFDLNTAVTPSGCRKPCQTHGHRDSVIHTNTEITSVCHSKKHKHLGTVRQHPDFRSPESPCQQCRGTKWGDSHQELPSPQGQRQALSRAPISHPSGVPHSHPLLSH